MIQEIFPHVFHNEFEIKTPREDSYFLYFQDGRLLLKKENSPKPPRFEALKDLKQEAMSHCDYLFSIDRMNFFLIDETCVSLEENDSLSFYKTSIIRDLKPMWVSFAAASAEQLHRFYSSNRFCGCCGSSMMKSKKERSMVCSSCGNTVYPKIAPAVIVAVLHEGKLLLTKYAGREYTRYALIAGYTEFGETLEETVKREVMEEVGLRVKNIRYYKNQPWAFSDSLLVGYWAELDGSPQIHLDETELSAAVWMTPEEIPDGFTNISLTHEMILLFKNGKITQ
ncbi:NAD(+) diphosphatase [Clostridium sp. Marseille-P2415]|uniref:NAD(+) diphosphatase n=1 Tax=Clostridium sp. Marseille-P2415 TaxID=1805471 RepID=UPI0009883B50|nr:NAD(+) diphosphatase [Clostridium sp. Marseille-P2415]